MQQYFVNGKADKLVTITDKDTIKHMFNVMRLTEDDEVVLVFDDGIKRLARVTNVQEHTFEIVDELSDNVELPVQVVIASGFPKEINWNFLPKRRLSWVRMLSGPFQLIGLSLNGIVKNCSKKPIS